MLNNPYIFNSTCTSRGRSQPNCSMKEPPDSLATTAPGTLAALPPACPLNPSCCLSLPQVEEAMSWAPFCLNSLWMNSSSCFVLETSLGLSVPPPRKPGSSLLQPVSGFWNLGLAKPCSSSFDWLETLSLRLWTCKCVCTSSIFCSMNPASSAFIYYTHLLGFMACLHFFMASLLFLSFSH